MISDPILTTMTLLYLASLSGCMFFGVLMLESGSPRFDIAVCLFTVVVIFLSHAIILGGDPSVSSDRLHFKDYADLPQWLQVHQVKNARRQRSRTIDKEGFKILLRSQASAGHHRRRRRRVHSSIRLSQIGTEPSCDEPPAALSRAPPRLCSFRTCIISTLTIRTGYGKRNQAVRGAAAARQPRRRAASAAAAAALSCASCSRSVAFCCCSRASAALFAASPSRPPCAPRLDQCEQLGDAE